MKIFGDWSLGVLERGRNQRIMESVHKIIWFLFFITFVTLSCVCYTILGGWSNLNMSPLRLAAAVFIPILMAQRSIRKRSLSSSGAIAGVCIAFFTILSHWSFLTSLMAFFLTGSKATKYKAEMKRKIEGDAYKEGGQRTWIQVFCNGGVAFQICLFYLMTVGVAVDAPLDFARLHSATFLSCAYLGAIACCSGDTWASEIGSVLSKGDPIFILDGKTVPRGTNGGVSAIGTAASLMGGMVVGFAYWIGLCLSASKTSIRAAHAPPQYPVILLGAIAGVLGSTIDSILGGLTQYSGWDEDQQCIVNRNSGQANIKHIRGRAILDNHSVNLISSMLTALILPYIGMFLF